MKYIIDEVTKSTKYIISAGGNGTKFGLRDIPSLNMKNNYHIGNDYNTPEGVKLYAPCDGEFLATRRVGNKLDYGNDLHFYMREFDHTLHLAHLNDIAHLEGKKISKGDYIGATGNTGKSTGAHLHLGIAKGKKKDVVKGNLGDGTWINPSTFDATSKKKSLTDRQVAQQIIDRKGNWGDGQARKDNLKAKGYDYNKVQPIINQLVKASKPKSNVGRTWTPTRVPLRLYPNSTGGTSYASSNAKRAYKVLAEDGGRIQISHKLFDSPRNRVWVNTSVGWFK